MARPADTKGLPPKPDPKIVAKALAKAVHDGDIVNFRLLFMPFSPARGSETEHFESEKYAYLLPDAEQEGQSEFHEALRQVQEEPTWQHVNDQLDSKKPPQLPSDLVVALADNAVRQGKYTSAAQAYELLRVRDRMQQLFFEQGDKALDAGDVPKAVRAYLVATGLEYDYAAFPEPLPKVPDYQRRALMLHGEYPRRPEDSIPLQAPETFLRTMLTYLLLSADAAARLDERPLEQRVEFAVELVRKRDPKWDTFVQQYRDTCKLLEDFRQRIEHSGDDGQSRGLAAAIEEQLGEDPRRVPATLLGRKLPGGEWWQYLKELAYEHPAAALFIARQRVGDTEILVPRFRTDSPVVQKLGLSSA